MGIQPPERLTRTPLCTLPPHHFIKTCLFKATITRKRTDDRGKWNCGSKVSKPPRREERRLQGSTRLFIESSGSMVRCSLPFTWMAQRSRPYTDRRDRGSPLKTCGPVYRSCNLLGNGLSSGLVVYFRVDVPRKLMVRSPVLF